MRSPRLCRSLPERVLRRLVETFDRFDQPVSTPLWWLAQADIDDGIKDNRTSDDHVELVQGASSGRCQDAGCGLML